MRKYILFLTIIIFCISCAKKQSITDNKLDVIDAKKSMNLLSAGDPSDILSYYSFIAAPNNGSFGFKYYEPFVISNRPERDKDSYLYLDFAGAFYDTQNNIIPGGTISFGPLSFYSDPKHGYFYDLTTYGTGTGTTTSQRGKGIADIPYRNIAGSTIDISINPVPGSSNLSNRGATGTLRIPPRVDLDKYKMTSTVDIGGTKGFKIGNYITSLDIYWNADPVNDKGVVIIMEYDADLSNSVYPNSPPASKKYYNAIRVPDNGHYTLKYSDVGGLAYDATRAYLALIVVTVGRANYTTLNDRDGVSKYAVYAASATDFLLQLNMAKYTN